jgi:spore coat protein U-like protein
MRSRLVAAALVAALVLGPGAEPSNGQIGLSCTISTTGVAFGAYNVFSAAPTDSTGTITYQCSVGAGIRIDLNRGASVSFNPRILSSGANTFNYNLFLDSAHTTIWGDGSGGTSFFTDNVLLLPKNVTVYGRIPAQQDAAVGSYTDSVTATIIF